MGQFSWFTQDTDEQIVNGERKTIYMTDDKGHYWVEDCYEGYGVFGGKDYYELLAEMNGFPSDRNIGIDLAFGHIKGYEYDAPMGDNPLVKHPSLTTIDSRYYGTPPKTDPNQGWRSFEKEEDEVGWHNQVF